MKTSHILHDVETIEELGITRELADKYENRICKCISLMKNTLVQNEEDIISLCLDYEINMQEEEEEVFASIAWHIYQKSMKITNIIDFDDMIWLPVIKKLNIQKFDIIYCDECQDLNNTQMALIAMAMKATTRFFAVGDDRQAIYGFRGASSGAMNVLKARFDMKVLSLPVTYRCPVKVVEMAKKIVPDYQAGENNPEGDIQEDKFNNLPNSANAGDFILSRTNAPLVKLAFRFFPVGKKAIVKGRDFGTNLINIVKDYKGDISAFLDWISNWEKKEVEKLLKRNPKASPDLIADKAECLKAISEDATSIKEIIAKIENLFADDLPSNVITLSTVHKAKGLETDKVFYLKDTFCKYQTEEEFNMLYVAITRAKKILVTTFGQGKEE
jgi:superfamily I DNA/RNA helicase